MATCRLHETSLIATMSTMHLLVEIKCILKALKSFDIGLYDKQNFTLVFSSYEFYDCPIIIWHDYSGARSSVYSTKHIT